MNARWSDETETYIADAFRRCDPHATGNVEEYHRSNARAVLKYLADVKLLLPPEVVGRVERGEVHQDRRRLGVVAVRTVWETPWLPEKIAEWERELLDGAVSSDTQEPQR